MDKVKESLKKLISLFSDKSVKKSRRIVNKCQEKTNYVNTEPKIETLTFYDMKKPALFITTIYDLETLIKKCLVKSIELLNEIIRINLYEIIGTNVTNKQAYSYSYSKLIYYDHAIRYIVDDIDCLSKCIDELSEEKLLKIIEHALSCISELYSVCSILKENCNDNFINVSIHRRLDDIIKLIKPYIKVKDEEIEESLNEKIYLKKMQNKITNEVGKCENPEKLNDINYIVTILLSKDLREVEQISEIHKLEKAIYRDLIQYRNERNDE